MLVILRGKTGWREMEIGRGSPSTWSPGKVTALART
jgi:hypothetical protein